MTTTGPGQGTPSVGLAAMLASSATSSVVAGLFTVLSGHWAVRSAVERDKFWELGVVFSGAAALVAAIWTAGSLLVHRGAVREAVERNHRADTDLLRALSFGGAAVSALAAWWSLGAAPGSGEVAAGGILFMGTLLTFVVVLFCPERPDVRSRHD